MTPPLSPSPAATSDRAPADAQRDPAPARVPAPPHPSEQRRRFAIRSAKYLSIYGLLFVALQAAGFVGGVAERVLAGGPAIVSIGLNVAIAAISALFRHVAEGLDLELPEHRRTYGTAAGATLLALGALLMGHIHLAGSQNTPLLISLVFLAIFAQRMLNVRWGWTFFGISAIAFTALAALEEAQIIAYAPLFAVPEPIAVHFLDVRHVGANLFIFIVFGACVMAAFSWFERDRLRAQADLVEALEPLETHAEDLSEQHRFVESILENLPDMVFVKEAERLTFVRFNRAGEELLGMSRDELKGRNDYDFFPREEADAFVTADRAVLDGGETLDIAEEHIQTRHGRRILHTKKIPLAGADGRPRYLVGISEDITARKHAERELELRVDQLARANEELDRFAAMASHDLKEPLRTLRSYTGFVIDDYRERIGTEGQVLLTEIQTATDRMQRLIDDLLTYARVGGAMHSQAPLELAPIVEGVLRDLQHAVQRSGGSVHVGALPTVLGDAVHMRQLFQNLISNSLKFARPGVPVEVRVDAIPGEHVRPEAPPLGATFAQVRVADNGQGFEQRYAERIFGAFQRLHTRDQVEGTGLGLAVCRKIVQRYGGRIWAEGRPGSGADVYVDLPSGTSRPLA